MYKMGLLKFRKPNQQCGRSDHELNPHGDMAIYETLVRLTTGRRALCTRGMGNFGKVYSRDMRFAAPIHRGKTYRDMRRNVPGY